MSKWAVLAAVLVFALPALAQIRVLVIDETQILEESLRLLAVVRALRATGAFSFSALSAFPKEPWKDDPFQVIVYLPPQGPFIWFCAPWPETLLPPEFREALSGLRAAFAQAFAPSRAVRGPGDDLYPLLLTLFFLRQGYMGGR